MTRTTWTLAFLFVSLFTAATTAADDEMRDPHIRSDETELLTAMRDGARRSPTLQRLVNRLETSDVVVRSTTRWRLPSHLQSSTRLDWRPCTSGSGSEQEIGTSIASIALERFWPASSSSQRYWDVTRN